MQCNDTRVLSITFLLQIFFDIRILSSIKSFCSAYILYYLLSTGKITFRKADKISTEIHTVGQQYF